MIRFPGAVPGRQLWARGGKQVAGAIDYGGVAFEADFLSARVGADEVRFTRAERLLLRAFTGQPGRSFGRSELLDVISGSGASASDRNIDFTINRLRRKLGDDARAPRFIATRYGEGYVWIARRGAVRSSSSFIVVGPMHGVDETSAEPATAFASALATQLDGLTDPARPVVFDPVLPVSATGDAASPQFVVSLSFLVSAQGRLECSVALRRGKDGHVLKVFRTAVPGDASHIAAADEAASIIDAVWKSLAMPAAGSASPTDVPLPVRLAEASEQMGAPYELTWRDAEVRLRDALARDPDDASSKLMLATAIHSKYILSGTDILAVSDPRRTDEAEIEALVTAALPQVEGNDIHLLGAAKLLDFVGPIYADFALQLAERAFAGTTAFAAAFATLGQFRMYRGDIDEAVRLFRLGSELAEPNSRYRYYLQVLLCEALLASGNASALAQAVEPLFVNEQARRFFAFLYPAPVGLDVSYDIETALDGMTPARGRAMILMRHYTSARRFGDPGHRQNVIGHVAGLIAGRLGPQCIAEEVAPDLPDALRPRVVA